MRLLATVVATVFLAFGSAVPLVFGASPGTVTFTEATLQFNPANGTKGDVTAGENVMQDLVDHPAQTLFSFCWPGNTNVSLPSMTVISDGSITGLCTQGLEDVSGVPVEVLPANYLASTLAGTFDPVTSTVSFVMEGSATQFASYERDGVLHPPVFTYTITVDVVGAPVIGNAATGMANFAYTCAPVGGGECGMSSATGTVEFNMLFFPAAPALTSPPVASPTPSPSPSSGPLSVTIACSADLRNVNCTATPSGAGDSADLVYAWTFNGSPQAGTGASFQYDFIEAQLDNGSYPVSVTVTDNNDGRTASSSDSVELGTFGSVADSSPNTLILLLILAGAGAAIIGAFMLWLRGRAPKPDFVRAAALPPDRAPERSFAVGSDRAGGFEDSLEYGEGAGTATPAASKAYEAMVVASSSQANRAEPLANPEGEVADMAQSEEDDIKRADDESRPAREGR